MICCLCWKGHQVKKYGLFKSSLTHSHTLRHIHTHTNYQIHTVNYVPIIARITLNVQKYLSLHSEHKIQVMTETKRYLVREKDQISLTIVFIIYIDKCKKSCIVFWYQFLPRSHVFYWYMLNVYDALHDIWTIYFRAGKWNICFHVRYLEGL